MNKENKILQWEPLQIEGFSALQNQNISERIRRILKEWEGTPHMDGQQTKGVACDCVHFVAGVLDELAGTTTPLNVFPPDSAFHSKETAWKAFRQFKNRFDGIEVPKKTIFQPGDVLIVGPRNGGPGHAVLVGADEDIWHCNSRKVVRTGLGYLRIASVRFKKALRFKNRKNWRT